MTRIARGAVIKLAAKIDDFHEVLRVLVSRTRCGILHAAPLSGERTKHRRLLRPRLCSAPLRKALRHSASKDARKRAYGAASGERGLKMPYNPAVDLNCTPARCRCC